MLLEKTIEQTRIPYQYPRTKEQVLANRAVWTAALRSGAFVQTTQVLRSSENEYCCMGVACELFGDAWINPKETGLFFTYRNIIGNISMPPEWISPAMGLSSYDRNHLMGMNDTGKTFSEIADAIDLCPVVVRSLETLVSVKELRDRFEARVKT